MLYKNIVYSLLLTALSCSSELLQADQSVDVRGRTPLMNFIIKQEKQLKDIKDNFDHKNYEIETLKNLFKDTPVATQGKNPLQNQHQNQHQNQSNNIVMVSNSKNLNEKNAENTFAMIASCIDQLKQLNETYDETLNKTLEAIVEMIQSGAQLGGKDKQGYTLLDFCETKEIYEILREYGAPFQWNTWFKFVDKTATTVVLNTLMISSLAYLALKPKFQ